MLNKIYQVLLTAEEKKRLEDIVSKGVHPARQTRRARILLLLNEKEGSGGTPVAAPSQREIALQCGCNPAVVYTVGKQYAEEGIERVLNRKKRETPPVPAKVTGEIEAKIIALSCEEPPAGYSRWTLRLLESKSKEALGIELSDTTIRAVLKKNTPKT
jgi:transposase